MMIEVEDQVADAALAAFLIGVAFGLGLGAAMVGLVWWLL